jgi:LuxR family maltose regulon positive regulatory protein
MGFAWGLLNSGELEAAEPRLRDVEHWLESTADRTLSLDLAAARVYLAQALGDAPGTLEHAKRALELSPEGDLTARATGTALVALALWGRGDLEAAHHTFADAVAAMRAAGRDLDAIRGAFVLGDIRVAQGRLREAATIYERGLQMANDAEQSAAAETDELHLGLSELHCEWNDLASAVRHLDIIAQSANRAAYKGNRLRWCTAMARVCEARGEFDKALELLDEGATHERRDPLPRVRPIPALKARVHIAQGRIDDAVQWVKQANLSVDDDLSYVREFEHITLARILIARHGARADAAPFLERLQTAAESGGRTGSVIEILILQSLTQHGSGNLRNAMDLLARALVLAEPEGHLRVFLNEGARMRELLRHVIARGLGGGYTRRVLPAFDAPKQPILSPDEPEAGLVQSLTAREREILRLIAAGLRNQEIADHLSISAATVKRHIANAYGKLGVGHRTEALARATELKLL